ncbi:hypothetical protein Dimus_026189, partial [Dionaea muscipula]
MFGNTREGVHFVQDHRSKQMIGMGRLRGGLYHLDHQHVRSCISKPDMFSPDLSSLSTSLATAVDPLL